MYKFEWLEKVLMVCSLGYLNPGLVETILNRVEILEIPVCNIKGMWGCGDRSVWVALSRRIGSTIPYWSPRRTRRLLIKTLIASLTLLFGHKWRWEMLTLKWFPGFNGNKGKSMWKRSRTNLTTRGNVVITVGNKTEMVIESMTPKRYFVVV